eukprot:gene24519-10123_t
MDPHFFSCDDQATNKATNKAHIGHLEDSLQPQQPGGCAPPDPSLHTAPASHTSPSMPQAFAPLSPMLSPRLPGTDTAPSPSLSSLRHHYPDFDPYALHGSSPIPVGAPPLHHLPTMGPASIGFDPLGSAGPSPKLSPRLSGADTEPNPSLSSLRQHYPVFDPLSFSGAYPGGDNRGRDPCEMNFRSSIPAGVNPLPFLRPGPLGSQFPQFDPSALTGGILLSVNVPRAAGLPALPGLPSLSFMGTAPRSSSLAQAAGDSPRAMALRQTGGHVLLGGGVRPQPPSGFLSPRCLQAVGHVALGGATIRAQATSGLLSPRCVLATANNAASIAACTQPPRNNSKAGSISSVRSASKPPRHQIPLHYMQQGAGHPQPSPPPHHQHLQQQQPSQGNGSLSNDIPTSYHHPHNPSPSHQYNIPSAHSYDHPYDYDYPPRPALCPPSPPPTSTTHLYDHPHNPSTFHPHHIPSAHPYDISTSLGGALKRSKSMTSAEALSSNPTAHFPPLPQGPCPLLAPTRPSLPHHGRMLGTYALSPNPSAAFPQPTRASATPTHPSLPHHGRVYGASATLREVKLEGCSIKEEHSPPLLSQMQQDQLGLSLTDGYQDLINTSHHSPTFSLDSPAGLSSPYL